MASFKKLFFPNRTRTIITILLGLVAVYALAGFLVVPWLARPKIEEAVKELIHREARLEKLKLNPFVLSGSMSGFSIIDTDQETLLSFDRAYANVQLFALLFKGEFHFRELDLAKPYFRFQVNKAGDFNIADIINQITEMDARPPDEDSEPKPVKVDTLRVADGSISVTDLSMSTPFTSVIAPINFDITGFHTSGESDAPYAFAATSESGETFSWKGFVALEPLRSKGSFEVSGFSMPKYEPFYDLVLKTDITGGTIGVTGDYDYRSGTSGVMKLENAAVTIENVAVVQAADQSKVMSLREGRITGINADYLANHLAVEELAFKEGSLFAKRLEDGTIDLLGLIKDTVTPKAVESAGGAADPAEASAPTYRIKKVSLDGFSIEVTDEAMPATAQFALDDVSLLATDIKSEAGSELGIKLGASVRSGGRMALEGSAGMQPPAGSFRIDLNQLALKAGNPYIAEFADIQLTSGVLSVSGDTTIRMENDLPKGRFSGMVALADLKVVEKDLGQDLVGLNALEIAGLAVELEPMAVKIDTIRLTDPRATVLINEDGSINLMKALGMEKEVEVAAGADPEVPGTTESPAEEKPLIPFPISIGSITLENAGAILTDRSISPSVNLGLETLSGTVSGLSSEELARADLDLAGTLTGGTKMAITGKINPLIEDRYSDVEMSFSGFNLTAVSRYAGKYAGYKLDKGKLSFDLKYKISQADLTGENVMVIDQLTLGDKVESEDALKLPIPLAISLMKDRNGVIELDVPVSGNLNDPEFGFGRVISRAILNVITKLITSPFSMLSGLIPGGKDVDLSQVGFAPAATAFDDDTGKILGLLADALKERPNLRLEIVGGAGGPAEVGELKVNQFETNLKTLRWKELQQAGDSTVGLQEVELTPQDRTRLIRLAFNQVFPGEAIDWDAAAVDDAKAEAATEMPDAAPPATETKSSTETEKPSGIGGFLRRIFGGGESKEETSTDSKPVDSLAEPVVDNNASDDGDPSLETTPPTPPTLEEMQSRIIESIEVNAETLQRLANERAEAVRVYLETSGEIGGERLFVVEPEDPASISVEAGEPRVSFNLE